MKNRTELNLGKVFYVWLIYHIQDSWPNSLNGYDSGAQAVEGRQAEPHTQGKKGNLWIDFLMCIMASGIARGRVRTTTTTTTTTTVESRNMAAMLQLALMVWQKHAPYVCVGSMPSFLSGIFKEKNPHPYQQTIAEVDLTFFIRVARIYSQRSSEKWVG